jgi:arsenate reductase (thioredoxin)
MADPRLRVLFLCTGNSIRSQMAEGWATALSHGQVEAFSAGTEPRELDPLAVKVMAESGADISHQRSKHLDTVLGQPFDYVITVCDQAKEACPEWPGAKKTIHWSFDDPFTVSGTEDEKLTVFRRVMFEIKHRVQLFLHAHKVRPSPPTPRAIHKA